MNPTQKNLITDTLTLMHIHEKLTEDCDCLTWVGRTNNAGHPKYFNEPARRVVWRCIHGEIPEGKLLTTTCGLAGCLNPEHLALTTKAEVSRRVNALVDVKRRKSASSAAYARPRLGKITMEIADQIRASDKTGKDWAQELGVSTSLVSLVRQGKSWVNHRASHWSGLGARA